MNQNIDKDNNNVKDLKKNQASIDLIADNVDKEIKAEETTEISIENRHNNKILNKYPHDFIFSIDLPTNLLEISSSNKTSTISTSSIKINQKLFHNIPQIKEKLKKQSLTFSKP